MEGRPLTVNRHCHVRSVPIASAVPAATRNGVLTPAKYARAASSAMPTTTALGRLNANAHPSTAGNVEQGRFQAMGCPYLIPTG